MSTLNPLTSLFSTLLALELNDQFVLVFGLHKRLVSVQAPSWVIDATGSASIYDPTNTLIAGPLAFTYLGTPLITDKGVLVPDGNYQALLPASFNPAVGSGFLTKVNLVSLTAGTANWAIPTVVAARTQ